MNITVVETHEGIYLEGISGKIKNERDAVDVVALCGEHSTNRLMLHADNLTEHFFDLKTRVAGDILQKFVNYGIKAVLVLPFKAGKQGRFGEMAIEANRSRHFGVFYDRKDAEEWLLNN